MPQTLRLPRPLCGLAMTQNWNVFVWKTDVFLFYAVAFCAVSLRIVFQAFISEIVPFSIVSFRKLLRFPAKPTRFVIARRARAPDAAIFDGTICHPGTNYGCAERNRTLKERERKRNDAANPFFVIGLPFLFRTPVLRHGMPCLRL